MKKDMFFVGEKYQAKKDFKSGTFVFDKGEVLIFDRGAYSPYDDCYIYEFHNLSGESKSWILQVDSSDDEWKEFFEVI